MQQSERVYYPGDWYWKIEMKALFLEVHYFVETRREWNDIFHILYVTYSAVVFRWQILLYGWHLVVQWGLNIDW